jgi:hypothetical protein
MFSPFVPRFKRLSHKNSDKGDAELQTGIRKLCVKYKSIFRNTIGEEPANIPPFDLDVDLKKWEQPRNWLPVRAQSLQKQEEIRKQSDIKFWVNIIEKSNASYYSQVMMPPKEDGSWRICADYRNMDDCTEPASWPLGKGDEIVVRIDSHKPDLFAVMDLNTGYHQAAMSLAARVYTAL